MSQCIKCGRSVTAVTQLCLHCERSLNDTPTSTSNRDQTYKFDAGKLMLELIPPETYEALGTVLTYGARKYSENSWQNVEPSRYKGALLRHFVEYLKDPSSIDKESGFLHIDHLLCNAMFLSYFERRTS